MNRPPLNHIPRLVFIAALLATLAGCGNKGPLVLPTPPAEPVTAPDVPAESPAEAPAETPAAEPTNEGTTTPPPEQTPVPAPHDGGGNG